MAHASTDERGTVQALARDLDIAQEDGMAYFMSNVYVLTPF